MGLGPRSRLATSLSRITNLVSSAYFTPNTTANVNAKRDDKQKSAVSTLAAKKTVNKGRSHWNSVSKKIPVKSRTVRSAT